MYQIYPISFTQPDWKRFILAWTAIFGESPTRKLDSNNFDIHNPLAYLACLNNNESDPRDALQFCGDNLLHVHLSLIIIFDSDRLYLSALQYFAGTTMITKSLKNTALLITGNLQEWTESLVVESYNNHLKQLLIDIGDVFKISNLLYTR